MPEAKKLKELAQDIRLLYVEDDEKLREDTLRLLSNFFESITVAVDGKEAFGLYQPGRFDIVISDLIMPLVNGQELTKRIKKQDPRQLVIILSAHDEAVVVDELKDVGVDFFLFKPLEINQFINTLLDVCMIVKGNEV